MYYSPEYEMLSLKRFHEDIVCCMNITEYYHIVPLNKILILFAPGVLMRGWRILLPSIMIIEMPFFIKKTAGFWSPPIPPKHHSTNSQIMMHILIHTCWKTTGQWMNLLKKSTVHTTDKSKYVDTNEQRGMFFSILYYSLIHWILSDLYFLLSHN